jgi:hypothetical protein
MMKKAIKRTQAEADISDDNPGSKEKRIVLRVKDIQFSQASVASTFADGRELSELVDQLAGGDISSEEIPPIRVVHYKE